METPNTHTDETDTAPLADVEADYTFDEEADDLMRELIAEGYSLEEARRMVGDSEDDDTCYGFDDLDRDLPADEYVDEEDFD